MAGLPGALGAILGNPILEQVFLFNVAGQVINGAITPFIQAELNESWSLAPNLPLSPAELALAVIRNERTESDAAAEARMSGLNEARFHTLARLTGDAPGPADLAVGLRRGFIDLDRYMTGIRQGRLRDEWADLVRQLSVEQPSPMAPLDAYLEGQISEARARQLYAEFGGDPANFDWLFDSRGSAPSPVELGELANRGIIGWTGQGPDATSFEQGFLEGPWRNKWLPAMRKLAEYVPPPRTVTAMVRDGSLTDAHALELFRKTGLSPELAAAYLASAKHEKVAPTKDLAQSMILEAYRDLLETRTATAGHLESLGYAPDEAEFILLVEDARQLAAFRKSAVGKVHSLYIGHKIDRTTAQGALGELDVPAENTAALLDLWTYERAVEVKLLTPAQIAEAMAQGYLDASQAHDRLTEQGYGDDDAWLFLSVHKKAGLGPYAGLTAPAPTAG